MNDFFRLIFCFIFSYFLCFFFCKFYLKVAKKRQYRQYIRNDIVSTHQKKKGTPTMGGICFLLATIFSYFLFDWHFYQNNKVLAILFLFLFFGFIGWIDDLYKIVFKNSKGISGIFRLLFECIGVGVFIFILGKDFFIKTNIPLFKIQIYLGSFFLLYYIIVILGTCNAVNFSDGLDGLSSGLIIISATPFLFISILQHNYAISMLIVAMMGSLFAFLYFNFPPAKLFMGDVGSLSLGGFYAGIAVILKSELLILISGGVFFLEILSVILQVAYFKMTHGKRLFLMAPLHHHFEKKGYPEWKVVMLFWIIAVGINIVALLVGVM